MPSLEILHKLCRSCDVCVAVCPHLALRMVGETLTWDAARCRHTGHCLAVCPAAALIVRDEASRAVHHDGRTV